MYPCRFCIRDGKEPYVVLLADLMGWDEMFKHLERSHRMRLPVNLPMFMLEWESVNVQG